MTDVDSKYIPNSLRRFRKLSGYKQKDVARILGFKSSSRISRWENGIGMPSLPNCIKLSILYSTLMDALYIDLFRSLRKEISDKKETHFNAKNKGSNAE
ncbi:MAG: helix-turn-helix transcriptional regulator [Bacteroidetes bacterium]|nr:helix-turn-helix transcriptional regulator [Bacteroidota bacterium]